MKYSAGGNLKQEWTSLTSRLPKVYIYSLKSWSRWGRRWPPFSFWEGFSTRWFYLFGLIDFLYPYSINTTRSHSLSCNAKGIKLRSLYYEAHGKPKFIGSSFVLWPSWRTRKLYNVNWFGLFINISFPWSVHLFAYLNIDSIDIFNFSQNGILSK